MPETLKKPDYSTMKRPKRAPVTYEIENDELAEPFIVRMVPLDDLEDQSVTERTRELYARFVTGGFRDEKFDEWRNEPEPYPFVDGEPVKLCWDSINLLCKLKEMIVEPRHEFEELVVLSLCKKSVWRKLQTKAAQCSLEGWQGKKSAASSTRAV